MSRHGLYQPKVADAHIRTLYQWAKHLDVPMTHLVHALLAHGIERLEQGVENVSEPPAGGYPRKQRKKRRAQYGKNQSERVEILEGHLGDCVFALEGLLTSPDLNLDCLEHATRDAIEVGYERRSSEQNLQ